MSTTGTERRSFDLLDPHLYRDVERLHEALSWMRANEPVYRDDRNGLWGITRHADLMTSSAAARCSSAGRAIGRSGRLMRST
ncbi:MAG: hypothetical protein ACKPDI_07975 [Actinomycetota bacterium]